MFRCMNCGFKSSGPYCTDLCASKCRERGDKPFRAYVVSANSNPRRRLFIPFAYSFPFVLQRIATSGGTMLKTDKCYGWDVPQDTKEHKPLQDMLVFLEEYGYRIHKVGAGNIDKVW